MVIAKETPAFHLRPTFAPKHIKRDKHGQVINTSHYSSLAASMLTVKQMVRVLRVTPYRLGKMLGVPQPHGVYQWGSTYRISALYLERMIHLLFLQTTGKLDIQSFPGKSYWDSFVAEV